MFLFDLMVDVMIGLVYISVHIDIHNSFSFARKSLECIDYRSDLIYILSLTSASDG